MPDAKARLIRNCASVGALTNTTILIGWRISDLEAQTDSLPLAGMPSYSGSKSNAW
jgi:hypothetical protein